MLALFPCNDPRSSRTKLLNTKAIEKRKKKLFLYRIDMMQKVPASSSFLWGCHLSLLCYTANSE